MVHVGQCAPGPRHGAIRIIHGDTAEIPTSGITGGSRSAQLAGSAIANASDQLVALARERAGQLLEAATVDVVVDESSGRFHVAGTPAVDLGWAEGAADGPPLEGVSGHQASGPTFPFDAHLAVVEVEIETGAVELARLVAFADYALILAAELPSFERVPMETPTPVNELGAKGTGKSGTVGSTPAVQNAIIDAVSHLGVRHIDMPCTPERVWRAINAANP